MKLETAAHTSLVMALEAQISRLEAQPPYNLALRQLAFLKVILEELGKTCGNLEWLQAPSPYQDNI